MAHFPRLCPFSLHQSSSPDAHRRQSSLHLLMATDSSVFPLKLTSFISKIKKLKLIFLLSIFLKNRSNNSTEKMGCLRHLLLLFFLLPLPGLTVAGQEALFQLVHLQEQSTAKETSIGVLVNREKLPLVSSSVLAAEAWLRAHVLSHYPSTNITTIIVGRGILCSKNHKREWSFVLPSLKNLHYSVTRWGLVNEIKVSAAFSPDCLQPSSLNTLKPLLSFLQDTSSGYTIEGNPSLSSSLHLVTLERLGFSEIRATGVIEGRKLSSSFPLSLPPDASYTFPPEASPFYSTPASPPMEFPASPPPCLPLPEAPAPSVMGWHGTGLWCVAKPTVPAEKLQEALDFACGEGKANCSEIGPNGMCYHPDNVVAHASYAFNSYWQMMKHNGGTCDFDGTAVLINSDPSFLHCHYELI